LIEDASKWVVVDFLLSGVSLNGSILWGVNMIDAQEVVIWGGERKKEKRGVWWRREEGYNERQEETRRGKDTAN
jgi:hypothetical protein